MWKFTKKKEKKIVSGWLILLREPMLIAAEASMVRIEKYFNFCTKENSSNGGIKNSYEYHSKAEFPFLLLERALRDRPEKNSLNLSDF